MADISDLICNPQIIEMPGGLDISVCSLDDLSGLNAYVISHELVEYKELPSYYISRKANINKYILFESSGNVLQGDANDDDWNTISGEPMYWYGLSDMSFSYADNEVTYKLPDGSCNVSNALSVTKQNSHSLSIVQGSVDLTFTADSSGNLDVSASTGGAEELEILPYDNMRQILVSFDSDEVGTFPESSDNLRSDADILNIANVQSLEALYKKPLIQDWDMSFTDIDISSNGILARYAYRNLVNSQNLFVPGDKVITKNSVDYGVNIKDPQGNNNVIVSSKNVFGVVEQAYEAIDCDWFGLFGASITDEGNVSYVIQNNLVDSADVPARAELITRMKYNLTTVNSSVPGPLMLGDSGGVLTKLFGTVLTLVIYAILVSDDLVSAISSSYSRHDIVSFIETIGQVASVGTAFGGEPPKSGTYLDRKHDAWQDMFHKVEVFAYWSEVGANVIGSSWPGPRIPELLGDPSGMQEYILDLSNQLFVTYDYDAAALTAFKFARNMSMAIFLMGNVLTQATYGAADLSNVNATSAKFGEFTIAIGALSDDLYIVSWGVWVKQLLIDLITACTTVVNDSEAMLVDVSDRVMDVQNTLNDLSGIVSQTPIAESRLALINKIAELTGQIYKLIAARQELVQPDEQVSIAADYLSTYLDESINFSKNLTIGLDPSGAVSTALATADRDDDEKIAALTGSYTTALMTSTTAITAGLYGDHVQDLSAAVYLTAAKGINEWDTQAADIFEVMSAGVTPTTVQTDDLAALASLREISNASAADPWSLEAGSPAGLADASAALAVTNLNNAIAGYNQATTDYGLDYSEANKAAWLTAYTLQSLSARIAAAAYIAAAFAVRPSGSDGLTDEQLRSDNATNTANAYAIAVAAAHDAVAQQAADAATAIAFVDGLPVFGYDAYLAAVYATTMGLSGETGLDLSAAVYLTAANGINVWDSSAAYIFEVISADGTPTTVQTDDLATLAEESQTAITAATNPWSLEAGSPAGLADASAALAVTNLNNAIAGYNQATTDYGLDSSEANKAAWKAAYILKSLSARIAAAAYIAAAVAIRPPESFDLFGEQSRSTNATAKANTYGIAVDAAHAAVTTATQASVLVNTKVGALTGSYTTALGASTTAIDAGLG